MGFVLKSCVLLLMVSLCAAIVFFTLHGQSYIQFLTELFSSMSFKVGVFSFAVIAAAFLVAVVVSGLRRGIKQVNAPQGESEGPPKRYVLQRPVVEFEKKDKMYTEEAVRKLQESEAYKRLIQSRGGNKANLNWQTRDKMTGEPGKDEAECSNLEEVGNED